MSTYRLLAALALVLTTLNFGYADENAPLEASVTIRLADGSAETRTYPLEIVGDVQRLTIPASDAPEGAVSVDVQHPWEIARAGEDGFFVLPNGMYGTWRDLPNGDYANGNVVMQTFGVKTPRGALAAILTGMNYEAKELVTLRNGEWRVFVRYNLNGDKPYEDFQIDYRVLPSERSTYADMAAVYRQYQLDRGEVRPLKERVAERPELAYAAQAPEVRVRLGWKPVPSPVPEQNAENEPEMHVAITFDRFMQIVDEFKRQGIGEAEFCLVGWNVGGHDGRYPQIFPVDERLGGEEKLRKAVAYAQENGYQIVCHQNYSDAYRASQIGGLWDEGFLLVKKDGSFNTYTTWGGGNMYETCPREMFERFPKNDFPKLRDLGFRGLHYIDVYSTVNPRTCYSEDHPLNKREFAYWTNKITELSQETFGGFASEGGFDYCIKYLDFALYISFQKPDQDLPALIERHVPYWQLVYQGIVMSNPFADTTNYTLKSRVAQLKQIEYGGRPHFYFYSKFKSSGSNWMGDADITCGTDEELRASVAKIKEGYDEFKRLERLQLEFMTSHDQIAGNVFLVGYADGTKIAVNYGEEPFEWEGKSVPALDYVVYEPEK
ncbi:MAG: hypothetical protein IKX88_08330 [Thermoguttaceae bacterium]|nr:hypothetical protein [Thermoguttaceae bacterium]